MNRCKTPRALILGLILGLLSPLSATAQPVLQNGGFEDNPPANFGNNIPHPIAPWVLGSGNQSNVVKVDGPGGYNYGPVGPESDASAPGAGIEQHYLDIANGANDFYQDFTPQCSGRVEYGAYFSRRPGGATGTAGITILELPGLTPVAPRQQTVLPLGNPVTDPWTRVAYTTVLTAGTTYRFLVDMDNEMNIDNAFVVFLDDCDAHDAPDFPTGSPTVEKTCEEPVEGPAGAMEAACTITVDIGPRQNLTQTRFVFVQEELRDPSGAISADAIAAFTAAGWNCTPPAPPFAPGDVPQCFLPYADFPPSGQVSIPLSVALDEGDEGTWENCARVSTLDYYAPAKAPDPADPAGAQTIHDHFAAPPDTGQDAPIRLDHGQSCAEIFVHPDLQDPEDPGDTVGGLCTPFEAEVTCDPAGGGYVVMLRNRLAGSFDPDHLEITVLTDGVSAAAHPDDPLTLTLSGAVPGQIVRLSLDAVETGGGSAPGLDLCCMGEIEVPIPQGMTCERPDQPELTISKTCRPRPPALTHGLAGQEDEWICLIDVHYSGPAPDAENPIVVSDPLVPGSGVTAIEAVESDDGWACEIGADGGLQCTIDASAEPDATAEDWADWSSTIGILVSAEDGFANCASAMLADGTAGPVTDCHAQGDAELSIAKTADSAICLPGETCSFTVTVSNAGSAPYTGPITLIDSATPVGGTITAITPPLCADPADLGTMAGCTGTVSIPAGGSTSFAIDYQLPGGPGAEWPPEGSNCVTLIDAATNPLVDPTALETHRACADFAIGAPRLSIVKTADEPCMPGETCRYTVTITAPDAPFSGNLLLVDGMGGIGGQVTDISPAPPGGCGVPGPMLACTLPVSIPAGGSLSFTVTASFSELATFGAEGSNRNCAYAFLAPDDADIGPVDPAAPPAWAESLSISGPEFVGLSCVPHAAREDGDRLVPLRPLGTSTDEDGAGKPLPEPEPEPEPQPQPQPQPAPALTPAKTLDGPCEVNRARRTATCDFTLSVTNTGDAPYAGPLVVQDTFGAPQPRQVTLDGGGTLDCLPAAPQGALCLDGSVSLEPGQSATIRARVTLPVAERPQEFENCMAIGIGQDPALRTRLIQSILNRFGINVGPVDGIPGPRTRAGIRTLQQRLGLPETGQIDDSLFEAVGVPIAQDGQQACAQAMLPGVEAPRATTPPRDCPPGQLRNSRGQCYTPQRPDATPPAPQRPSCDPNSTVARGDGCACRYDGMRPISPTSCVCRNTGLPPIPGLGCPQIRVPQPSQSGPPSHLGGGQTGPQPPAGQGNGGGQNCQLRVGGFCLR